MNKTKLPIEIATLIETETPHRAINQEERVSSSATCKVCKSGACLETIPLADAGRARWSSV